MILSSVLLSILSAFAQPHASNILELVKLKATFNLRLGEYELLNLQDCLQEKFEDIQTRLGLDVLSAKAECAGHVRMLRDQISEDYPEAKIALALSQTGYVGDSANYHVENYVSAQTRNLSRFLNLEPSAPNPFRDPLPLNPVELERAVQEINLHVRVAYRKILGRDLTADQINEALRGPQRDSILRQLSAYFYKVRQTYFQKYLSILSRNGFVGLVSSPRPTQEELGEVARSIMSKIRRNVDKVSRLDISSDSDRLFLLRMTPVLDEIRSANPDRAAEIDQELDSLDWARFEEGAVVMGLYVAGLVVCNRFVPGRFFKGACNLSTNGVLSVAVAYRGISEYSDALSLAMAHGYNQDVLMDLTTLSDEEFSAAMSAILIPTSLTLTGTRLFVNRNWQKAVNKIQNRNVLKKHFKKPRYK